MDYKNVIMIIFSHLFFGFVIYVDYHVIKFAKKEFDRGKYTIVLAWLSLVSFVSSSYTILFLLLIRACGYNF